MRGEERGKDIRLEAASGYFARRHRQQPCRTNSREVLLNPGTHRGGADIVNLISLFTQRPRIVPHRAEDEDALLLVIGVTGQPGA